MKRLTAFALPSILIPVVAWPQVHGTTAAVICTPDSVVIVADSWLTDMNGSLIDSSSCKVRKFRSNYYVVAGLNWSKKAGYDVWTLLSKAANVANSLKSTADLFVSADSILLRDALNRERDANIATFDSSPHTKTVQAVYFIGVEEGRTVCYFRAFMNAIVDGKVKLTLHSENSADDLWYRFVPFDLDQDYLVRLRQIEANDPLTLAREFVLLAINKHPTECGFPIDYLILRKDGSVRDGRRTTCRNLDP